MTNEDTPATMIPVLANDSDPDPDPDPSDVLTVSSHTTPANGSMTVEEVGNTITYTPRADFHGVYTFTYTASGGALSAEASAIVTVRAVNDAPEFPLGSDQRRVATNTAPGTEVGSPVEANDRDGDTPTYDLAGADASSFEIDQYTRQITVGAGTVPDPTMQASYEVTVTADDQQGGTASIRVTITVQDPAAGGGGGGGGGGPTPSDIDFEWERQPRHRGTRRGPRHPHWHVVQRRHPLDRRERRRSRRRHLRLRPQDRRAPAGPRVRTGRAQSRPAGGVWSDRTTIWIADSG